VAGVIRVKAQFANKETRLWPGQYVNTRLVAQVLKDAMVIPQNAIISNTRGTFVYTVDDEQKAKVEHQTPVCVWRERRRQRSGWQRKDHRRW
jgi:multidrug efflux pump subunit AcrA (membrane-fusion protein)